jgi:hypothetical protein
MGLTAASWPGRSRRIRHDRLGRYDCGTRKFTATKLSTGQCEANRSHSAMRAPGELTNAELKNWRILRKIRSSPAHASLLVNAVQTVIINSCTTVAQEAGKDSMSVLNRSGGGGPRSQRRGVS